MEWSLKKPLGNEVLKYRPSKSQRDLAVCALGSPLRWFIGDHAGEPPRATLKLITSLYRKLEICWSKAQETIFHVFDLMEEEDKMCGVIGIYDKCGGDVARDVYVGLVYLQHRGQECSGIVTSDGNEMQSHRKMGTVNEVYHPKIYGDVFGELQGRAGIGHNRYSTTGESDESNIQPIIVESSGKSLAIAHNGNLRNIDQLKRECESNGYVFKSTTDTEVIGALLALSSEEKIEASLLEVLPRLEGAFSLVILCGDKVIGVRDKFGIRPLSLAQSDGKYVLISESCAIDRLNLRHINSVAPGEIVILSQNGVRSLWWSRRASGVEPLDRKICIFEYIYFASPDSVLEGAEVHSVRRECGRVLARQAPVEADMVIAVPDSGVSAAIGYAQESGTPYDMGLFRSHQVGRTFMEPVADHRESYQRLKHNPLKRVLRGKRIVVVDDSIVRGSVSRKIIQFLKDAGVSEIHLRIASPPVRGICGLGIDTPTYQEIIAAHMSIEEIERDFRELGLSSLAYLGNINKVKDAIIKHCDFNGSGALLKKDSFCTGCFTGDYPV